MALFSIGDKVRISAKYRAGEWYHGLEGYISKKVERSPYAPDYQITYYFLDNYSGLKSNVIEVPNFIIELIEKGDGSMPVVGKQIPVPDWFWNVKPMYDYINKLKRFRASHPFEGFTNGATYLATLYLSNDFKAYSALKTMRRKDGTLNANKVKKLFYQRGLSVDDWALELELDPPQEFKDYGEITRLKPAVNWSEVAESV